MGYGYAVIGAGRQGVAAAYDLVELGNADRITLLDVDDGRAVRAAERVHRLTGEHPVEARRLDVEDREDLVGVLRDHDVALSAVPYHLNVALSEAAIAAGVHLCDLGGSTETVFRQLEFDPVARQAGIAIVPDCGLAPGTANVLATYAIERLRELGGSPQQVKIYCGGLPHHPRPPLHYQLLFSTEGLIKEYTAPVHVLRHSRRVKLEPLTEVERLEFPEPVGHCEAFLTSGGTSTAPWTYEGVLQTYEYKTVRYPGHAQAMNLLNDLGLLAAEPVEVDGVKISPRAVFQAAVTPQLTFPDEPDVVVLRVRAQGALSAGSVEVRYDLVDLFDEETGFTAMERTTGFSAAIVMRLLARGEIPPGVGTPERVVPAQDYVHSLLERGFQIRETVRKPLQS